MEKYMQHLEGLIRKACSQYGLIEANDHICVGVSGGKDSVLLALALQRLRSYYEHPFTLSAVTLDPGFLPNPLDFTAIRVLFEQNEIPYTVISTDIGRVVFEIRNEKNPCSLCAKMRRGILHDHAKALGCNKIALGHHLDDAIETFFMNLFGEGRIACFSPKSYLSRKDLTMIRPMVLATEDEVLRTVQELALPIVKSGCPIDGSTQRENMKQYITQKSAEDPAFRKKMLGALQKANISGWGVTDN